jgi:type IV pilus assembly protein PilM
MIVIDFLKNLFNKIPSLFSSKKGNSVFGLDVGLSSVKVVQLRRGRGRVVLETYGELATGPYGGVAVGQAVNLSPENLTKLIGDLFKEANITATAGVMSIPTRSSLIVDIDLPEVDEEKLASIVPIEARKYVPVAISEVTLDWLRIPSPSDIRTATENNPEGQPAKGLMKILLVAIQNDSIRDNQALANNLNLKIPVMEIETFSSIRSCLRNEMGATALIDMGASSTKIVIVDRGVIRESHTISRGSQDISIAISRSLSVPFAKAEEIKREVGLIEKPENYSNVESAISPSVEYIFAEVERVVIKYQKDNRRSVDKVILVGGGSTLKGLVSIAEQAVGVPVIVGNPFEKTEAPAFLSPILSEAGPSFAVSVGLALRGLEEI